MFKCKNFEEFLSIQIELLFLLKIKNKKLQLKSKPKKFYIHCIYLHAQNIDISSIDAAEMLRDYMGWMTSDNVYSYRTNLKKTGWFVDDPSAKGGYNILQIFRYTQLPTSKEYKFELTYDI